MKFKMDEIGNLTLTTNEHNELVTLGKLSSIIPNATVHQRSDLERGTYELECRINDVVNALLKK